MWQKIETKIGRVEYLRLKSGAFVGYVIQFDASQTFAWTAHAKIGSYESFGEAKDAVEGLLK